MIGLSSLAGTVEKLPAEVETDVLSFAADALFMIFGLILIVFALYYAVTFAGPTVAAMAIPSGGKGKGKGKGTGKAAGKGGNSSSGEGEA